MSVLSLPTTHAPGPSLNERFAALSSAGGPPSLPLSELVSLVTAVAAEPHRWRPALRIPAPAEQRWWTRLFASTGVDVWLLAWLPGHTTELHDHGASAAAFTVVRGELTEDRPRRDGRRVTHARPAGSVTALTVGMRHDVTGAGAGPAVSIHAYSPPLTRMNYFDEAGSVLRTVTSHEPEEELQR